MQQQSKSKITKNHKN